MIEIRIDLHTLILSITPYHRLILKYRIKFKLDFSSGFIPDDIHHPGRRNIE